MWSTGLFLFLQFHKLAESKVKWIMNKQLHSLQRNIMFKMPTQQAQKVSVGNANTESGGHKTIEL